MNQNYINISIEFTKKIVEHYVWIKNHNSKFKQFQHPESNIILNIMILTFLTSLIYLDMYFKSKVKKKPTLLHVPVRTNQYIGHLNCIKLFFLNTRISQLDICSTDIDLQKIKYGTDWYMYMYQEHSGWQWFWYIWS